MPVNLMPHSLYPKRLKVLAQGLQPSVMHQLKKNKPDKTYRGNVSKFGNNDYLCIVNKVSKE